MDKLTKAVVDKLLDWGADLVGIAPVSRFANAPEGHKPTDFLPECRTDICRLTALVSLVDFVRR